MLRLVIVLIFCLWNIAVMFLYGADKIKAEKGRRRISENTLLLCAFCGGGFGALLGMKLFRHKTQKAKFRILVPLAFVLTLASFIFIYGRLSTAPDSSLIRAVTNIGAERQGGYIRISASEALAMMEGHDDIVILDVRSQGEFDAGHIRSAVLLPAGEIRNRAGEVLPSKTQIILVYCRSGARSQTAARTLISMGYLNVYDFGGILSWPYEVVR